MAYALIHSYADGRSVYNSSVGDTRPSSASITNLKDDSVLYEGANEYRYRKITDSWVQVRGDSGAAHVTDGVEGLNRSRYMDVVAATAISTANGNAQFASPVRNIVIDSVLFAAGTFTLAQGSNLTVRWSIAGSIAQANIELPTTFPSAAYDTDLGEQGSFNLAPIGSGATAGLYLPAPIEIPFGGDISMFSMAHNVTGATLRFGIRAIEVVQ